eukprot:5882782-Amphidinium_carterae.1
MGHSKERATPTNNGCARPSDYASVRGYQQGRGGNQNTVPALVWASTLAIRGGESTCTGSVTALTLTQSGPEELGQSRVVVNHFLGAGSSWQV